MKKQYTLHLFLGKAICPLCSGLLITIGEDSMYKCMDCNTSFEIVDMGMTDHEVICEQIQRKGRKHDY